MKLARWLLVVSLALAPGGARAEDSSPAATPDGEIVIVALGDSITKGVRSGVKPEETFAAIAERKLKEQGVAARVLNLGIGGERTDQALARLDDIAMHRPRLVTVMYGTNDSYVDQGKTESRLSREAYQANLKRLVAALLERGIEPILMTEPRWGASAKNGLGENPNLRLAPFMEACRETAHECHVPCIDHFALWTAAEQRGQKLDEWTTDGCHPNPRGHEELADALLPVLLGALRGDVTRIACQVKLETVLKHDDGQFLWFHPRAVALPGLGNAGQPAVVMTLQKHLHQSDHYSGLSVMGTDDLGGAWSGPEAKAELDWVHDGDVDIAVADVTPGWHPQSGKVLAVGAQVRYSRQGVQLEDQPRANQTAYAVFDPKTNRWTRWRRLEMPSGEQFNFARSACAQFVVEADGSLLLPFYIAKSADVPYSTVVVRCSFDGDELKYREHGDVLSLNVARGLYEPSLIRSGGRYCLTIRNDERGYVTCSDDGLHFRPIKPWLFDDGAELGSYNTQQHWLAARDGLFLVYTRRGANNDHVIRHRAPLFMAQVDPQRLCVLRDTERVLVPERGATLGNFGAAAITDNEAWVTVSEGIWNDDARRRGAEGSTFLARVTWSPPECTPALPQTETKLQAGEPVRVVCLGDSVTGVYYHTGGRRAYTDMLGIALRRLYPKADIATTNAGISGNTTVDALARLDRDVLAHKPALVTVMFGLNDMTRVPLEQYRENLQSIVDRCRESSAEVVLCTPNNVISTSGRPTEKLVQYCQIVREVAAAKGVPLCDCYAEWDALRSRDPLGWRLRMSDAIHPNMDGHKQFAELLAHSISGRSISLADEPPPRQPLATTFSRIKSGAPVKILAMPPLDEQLGGALKQLAPHAALEIMPWPVEGKSLSEIEQDAQARVRPLKPDLVVLAVPRAAQGDSLESFIHSYSWIMNWSLSFATQEWDCLVVHPSLFAPEPSDARHDALIRQLVRAQDLTLVDRPADNQASAEQLLADWLKKSSD